MMDSNSINFNPLATCDNSCTVDFSDVQIL